MAEGKKSFVLYSDLLSVVKKLIEKDRKNKSNNAGEFFLHILEYVSDLNPEPINDTVDLVFEPVKLQLKRDLTKWESRSERSRENGKLGGRPSKKENLKELEKTQQVILEPKKPDSDNVIMCNSMLNVNANEIKDINTPTAKFSFFKELVLLGIEKDLANDWLAVRKTKRLTNTKTAFSNLKTEIEKSGKSPSEIIKHCVNESWGGFKASWKWENNNLNNTANGKQQFTQNRNR